MDSVELVIAFEAEFALSISDEEAERMITVGDVMDFVARRVGVVPAERCETRSTFFRLRRALAAAGVATRLHPSTPLRSVVPARHWPGLWRRLRASHGESHWPDELPRHFSFWTRRSRRTSERGDGLGHLAHAIAPASPRLQHGEGRPWTREQIDVTVRRVIDEQLGVRAWRLERHTCFVADLGIE